MSGETEAQESGWTIDTLRYHVQRQLDDQRNLLDERYATQTKALDAAFVAAEKAVATALQSAREAVAKAEVAAEKRFESVNEFRAQLSDQVATFPTRIEVNTRLDALAEKVAVNASQLDRIQGRIDQRAVVMTAVSLLLALVATAATVYALTR